VERERDVTDLFVGFDARTFELRRVGLGGQESGARDEKEESEPRDDFHRKEEG
jgi:hypothetical protein